ncbi:NAD(P)H-hydrate dehydratase [Neopusillimonas aestuarii]|uniref:NAD(P)H-hydrate dehydratase n=1 Tax=Neopusillimonas aestuarii TaxID=2716226 RepID=UPI00197D3EF5|nr:NAD(P)H-hydrate dehydratase [Pusillimonas sp. DMV24BSW_D]
MINMFSTALLTPQEMGRADQAAMAGGVPGATLMDNAGRAVAREIVRRWSRRPVLVACGPGNNGGDGYVAARYLADWGWPVTVASLEGRMPSEQSDAAHHAALWRQPVVKLSPALLDTVREGLVIDALFGAGLARPPSGDAAAFIQALNDSNIPVCAVDLPSGVNGEDGAVLGAALQAQLTITFFRKKPGHVLFPGRALCGPTIVAQIGIPDTVLPGLAGHTAENNPDVWSATFPWPQLTGHKYSRGHALVVGGNRMTGAARLAARAAARVGSGLVTLAAPEPAWPVYATALESIMVEGFCDDHSFESLLADTRKNVLVVGPGLGVGETTRNQTLRILATQRACVLDADAISSFSAQPERLFRALSEQSVLTPHEGEFARVFNVSGSKLERARTAARTSGAVVLLKGPDTVIAHPNGRAIVNTNAPPDLATGGAGDVLAGMIAGLMAQGMPPFNAACAACWLHGEAARQHGPGLVADDLIHLIPAALKVLRRMSLG